MDYIYRAILIPDPDGGMVVTFPDVPEAITFGADRTEALESAREALALALRGIAAEGRELPAPTEGEGFPVAVPAEVATKLAVISAFRKAGISKSELARRLDRRETEARRILDPDHPTKLGLLTDALRVLGQDIVISVRQAA
ncbi:type II toxin-antitoxin system HicB family antitoxin [Rhizobium sp. FY34]|uniref:type II toxin-antitoxin system HicB family antitoxin n=1 Tax=Rhizobium sp. FY34 TaxID=2562309 RepID=UPI0010BFD6EB|nr:type II toxin-antitoxin system HicB family antitoxin [Rhizobium sp. FY34]